MTMLKKALLIFGVGTAAAFLTLGGVWLAAKRGTPVFTDGKSIRVPTSGAPVRSILWQPAAPLPESVNSTADEYEPRISADGTIMVFVRGKPGANADLFQAKWTPDGWSEPAPIATINTNHDELGPELSRDAKSLVFYSDRPGGLGGYDLWIAQATDDGWSTPINLGPNANSSANEYGPALTPDGAELFFASNRPRPGEPTPDRSSWTATVRETRDRHDYDLYVSRLGESGAEAAAPILELNTSSDEGAPALSPVGDFLYFASDRQGGLGGFDIYRARRDDRLFNAPENIGAAVNSSFSDLDPALSMDGFRLHFSSNRPLPGSESSATDNTTRPPDRYGVWLSHSREVYRESEASNASFLDMLMAVLPWLLLLLLALLLALILPRLWLDQRVKARFRKLSLLAQCLLVSLALHVLIASLLALWKVGSHIAEIVAEQGGGGGGTRVVLASSSGDGDGFSSQLRGELTSEMGTPSAPELAAADLAAAALESAAVRTDAGATEARDNERLVSTPDSLRNDSTLPSELAPMQAPDERPQSVQAAAPSSAPANAPVTETALTSSTSAAPAPSARPSAPSLSAPTVALQPGATTVAPSGSLDAIQPGASASNLTSHASAPAATGAVPVSGGLMDAAAPTAEAPRASGTPEATLTGATAANGAAGAPTAGVATASVGSNRVDVGVGPSSVADGSSASGINTAATSTGRSDAATSSGPVAPVLAAPSSGGIALGDVAVPGAAPAAGSGDKSEATLSSAAVTGSTGAPGPAAVSTGQPGASGTVRTDPGASSGAIDEGTRASIPSTASGTAGLGGAAASAPLASSVPGSSGPSLALGKLALPSAPGDGNAGQKSKGEATLPGAGALAGVGAAPGPAAITTGGGASGQGTVRTDPGATSSAGEGTRAVLNTAPTPGNGAAGPSTSAPITLQLPSQGSGGLSLSLGLPIAEEPPAPKETFAQRAPEVRSEILDKMGGSAETEQAVGRALDWFARHQEINGSWTGRRFDHRCRECDGAAEFDSDAAMTGLALLCYLGAGHTPDKDGPYRAVVSNGIDFLLARQQPNGDLRRDETMYSQSIATVALCEAYSMTRDKRLGDSAKRAVEFMCEGVRRAANRRQDERARADDTSVLGWQVMAMESARRAGIEVPDTTFRSATSFLDKVSNRRSPGQYSYSPGEAPSAAMTAEAMFVQQLMGRPRTEARMEQSATFILQTPPRWKEGASTYYWYYATLALFQHQGDAWKQWNDALVPELLANQRKEGGAMGSWDPQDQWSRMGGRIYQTAVCTLSLEVYYRYKPANTTLRSE